jgi:hypothetical protein
MRSTTWVRVCVCANRRPPQLKRAFSAVCFRYTKCNSVQQFAAMTLEEKQDWSRACDVEYPCAGCCRYWVVHAHQMAYSISPRSLSCADRYNCVRDFRFPCPAGWGVFEDQSCIAPDAYAGNCATARFIMQRIFMWPLDRLLAQAMWGLGAMSVDEKKGVVAKCEVLWPCFGVCARLLVRRGVPWHRSRALFVLSRRIAIGDGIFGRPSSMHAPTVCIRHRDKHDSQGSVAIPRLSADPARHALANGPIDGATGVIVAPSAA